MTEPTLTPIEALEAAEAALAAILSDMPKAKTIEEQMALAAKIGPAQSAVDKAKRFAADALFEANAAARNAMVERIKGGELVEHFGNLAELGITAIRIEKDGTIEVSVGVRKSANAGAGNGGPKPRHNIVSDGTTIAAGDEYVSRTFLQAVADSGTEWAEEAATALDRAKNWADPKYGLKAAPGFDASVKKLVAAIPGVAFA